MKFDYTCQDCSINTRKNKKDFYMVTDELWAEHGVGKKMLCMNCFEIRLGRKLQKDDFTDAFCNLKVNPIVKNLKSMG